MNNSNSNIESVIASFESIGLGQLDKVSLLNRQDTKFILGVDRLAPLLEKLKDNYSVLEVNGLRETNYKSLYYDSPDLKAYRLHHNGKLNRYKVRYREYLESGLSFFEIKHKTNKKRTVKSRIPIDAITEVLGEKEIDKIAEFSPLNPDKLEAALWVYYRRITFASKDFSERATLDFDLSFEAFNDHSKIDYPAMAIFELKQDRFNRKSPLFKLLRSNGIFPFGISKYCLGIMNLFDDVKENRFKAKKRRISKILQPVNKSSFGTA